MDPDYAHFQVHDLILGVYQHIFTWFNVQNTHFSHTVHRCSSSIRSLTECFFLVPVSLRPSSQNTKSALIGQHSDVYAGSAHSVFTSTLQVFLQLKLC